MHPFPAADEFECLIGEEIEQVCIGSFQVQLRFGNRALLALEEGLEQRLPDGTTQAFDCDAANTPALSLHLLLMRPLLHVTRTNDRLTLDFGAAGALTALSELGPYESGQFTTPDGRVLIF